MGGGAGSRHSLGQSLLSKKERRAAQDPHRQRLPHSGSRKPHHTSPAQGTSSSAIKSSDSSSSSSSSKTSASSGSGSGSGVGKSSRDKIHGRSRPQSEEQQDEALMSLLPAEPEEEREDGGAGILSSGKSRGSRKGQERHGRSVHWTEMSGSGSGVKDRQQGSVDEDEETVWLTDQNEVLPSAATPPRIRGQPLVGMCIEGQGRDPPRGRRHQVKAAVTSLLDTHFAHSDAVRDFNEAMPVSVITARSTR